MIPPSRLVIASTTTGFETYEKPFLLDNVAFPVLQNALCWRRRLIKKPGTFLLGQLERSFLTTTLTQQTSVGAQTVIADLINDASIGVRTAQPNAIIDPGSVTINVNAGTATWDDHLKNGVLSATGGVADNGTINYLTGHIVLNFGVGNPGAEAIVVTFIYNPVLPVMGIEEFDQDVAPSSPIDFPINVFFDQVYSYQYNGTNFFDVSFYKSSGEPVTWSGTNYEQFFSCNYYRAMFVTNNNPGFHAATVHSAANAGPSTTLTFVIYSGGVPLQTLVNGDYLFFNQGVATTFVNGQSGVITDATGHATGTYVVTFQSNQTVNTYTNNSAIVLLQTSQVAGLGDGIRWYDGFGGSLGWVNFTPPLDTNNDATTTYLMGARMILPFGNRLLAIGTFEGTSAQGLAGTWTYYPNRIRYCEVTATPFYSQPVPNGNAATNYEPRAWASNIQGFGGFIDLDTQQRILSAAVTQGSLILGIESEQRRMSNTGIETDPFSLQVINPEYGSVGTFGIIPMDKGILTVGEYGLLITSSYDSKRFDEKIIDQIFSLQANNNGFDRICGARDFRNEVIYFTYVSQKQDTDTSIFPAETIVFNYREGSFALWDETYTTYGLFKVSTGQAWETITTPWEDITDNWEDLGGLQYQEPLVAGGTPQGFVLLKWADNSANDPSLLITAITVGTSDVATITSPNHNLKTGMFLGFWNTTIPDEQPEFIGQISQVPDANTIIVGCDSDPSVIMPLFWQMSVIDQPNIFTKQFPMAWNDNKKTRIGAQKYFLDNTALGEFTVNIYGSQSTLSLDDPSQSPSLISSNIVRTRPDDSLGLNDAQNTQAQIWHRLATSAIGDTVQLQFTFSTDQMFDVGIALSPWVFHAAVLDLYPSRLLA